MNNIHSTGWGKRPITFMKSSQILAISTTGWFNLSRWCDSLFDDHELDALLPPLFHERFEVRESAERELALRLARAAIGNNNIIKDETFGSVYNGPRIKRKHTNRITLRELTIIVVEHRALVVEWKRKCAAHKAVKPQAPRAEVVLETPQESAAEPEPVEEEEPPDNWEDLC
jgi:hypothetical protein